MICDVTKEKFIELKREFLRISKKGYIKGITNNYSSIGRTFENELRLPENEFSVSDYYGIEIKTRRAYSKSAITLFNATFDGEDLFEIERLKNNYGYPCKSDRNYKVIYIEAFGDRLNFAGVKYQYRIDVDRSDNRIYLCVYNKHSKLIERKIYWSFDYIRERVLFKLNYLAVVNAWTNQKDGWNYFKYYKIDFFKLKGFDDFLNLLENGKIKIVIKVGIYLDEKRYGKTNDHGCGFAIKSEDLLCLYDKININ